MKYLKVFIFLTILPVEVLGENCDFEHVFRNLGERIEGHSPGYPERYPPNANCTWIFNNSAPNDSDLSLYFTAFDIEANGKDYLNISFLELGGWQLVQRCGFHYEVQQQRACYRKVTDHSIKMQFVSDDSEERWGFSFVVEVIPNQWERTTESPSAACKPNHRTLYVENDSRTHFTSPEYPLDYPKSDLCGNISWSLVNQLDPNIALGVLDFSYVDIWDNFDRVLVHEGPNESYPIILRCDHEHYCTNVTLTRPAYWISFWIRTWGSCNGGFYAQLKITTNTCSYVAKTLFLNETFEFSSAGFPYSYPEAVCVWKFANPFQSSAAILIDFDIFRLRNGSRVRVFGARNESEIFDEHLQTCEGVGCERIVYTGYAVYVVMEGLNSSTVFPVAIGFHATTSLTTYPTTTTSTSTTSPFRYSAVVHLNESNPELLLTSPHYPNPYPSYARCRWDISSPARLSISFHNFQTTSGKDLVILYDGDKDTEIAVCSGEGNICFFSEFTTKTSHLIVTFVSQFNKHYSGFSADVKVSGIPSTTRIPTTAASTITGSLTPAQITGIIFGLFGGILIFTMLLVCLKKKQRQHTGISTISYPSGGFNNPGYTSSNFNYDPPPAYKDAMHHKDAH